METTVYDVCIIGAGIIGASISRELSRYRLKTVSLEKNKRTAMETSEGNSGVIHGGFDPTPRKINATLNIEGCKLYQQLFHELAFPHQKVNSLVIAFNDEEIEHIRMLYQRGIKNGVNPVDLKIVERDEILKLEPNINLDVSLGLLCTSSFVVDPVILTKSLFSNAIKNDHKLFLESEVENIEYNTDHFKITVNNNENNGKHYYYAKYIVNAAGHYCDVLAKKAGYCDFTLITKRGEYRVLEKSEANLVKNIIFMVPTTHGKGVIVAPMLDGHLLVGPTAQDNVAKEDTRLVTSAMFESIGNIGKKIIPKINMEKTCKTFSGSRPIEPLNDDFYIKPAKDNPHFINVAGIKSPGLSAAPAIAKMVCTLLQENGLQLDLKSNFDPYQTYIMPLI